MSANSSNNKLIAKNTTMLYIRMLLSMVVSLYTSRVVLATLGVEDYGIYGVVGGVVSMMGFLNASMSGATSRFLTFELGRGNKERLAKTFSSALIVHIIVALIVFVVSETVGFWFLCNKLVIPEGRMAAAHWVYQLSIFSAMLTITQVPYNSSIISHEKMDIYAYVEILNVTLKLLIVYLLVIGNFDKLILYAILTLTVSVIVMIVYRIYCIRHFEECHFHWVWDKGYLKPLLSFSGWEVFGHFGFTFRTQGTNMVLNMVYGTVVNAAAGLATTIQGILQGFSQNIITAIRPQIIKRYASGEFDSMAYLMYSSTRISIFFASVTCIPVLLNIKYILSLWLVDVPQYCVVFCQYMLLTNIVSSVSQISYIGLHASGNIKYSSICRNIIYILTPFVIWGGMYYFSIPPQYAYLCILLSQLILMTIDISLVKYYLPFCNILVYVHITIQAMIALLLTFFVSRPLCSIRTTGIATFLITVLASVIALTASFYIIVFTKRERQLVNSYVKKTIKRL